MGQVYAQTNLQLYRQLRHQGYSDEDLALIQRAYDLGVVLFTSSFRGSGKPLLAHLVGTASILASINEPARVVTAGLLHAAYALGDFGSGRKDLTGAKRERLRKVVGADVEELVAQYTRFTWNKHTIPRILSGVATLEREARDVLVIRLANELEDHLDLGVLYCQNADSRRDFIRSPLNQSVDMARMLGLTALAEALEAAFAEVLAAELPASLRTAQDVTFMQPPASHMPRPVVVMRRYLDDHPSVGRAVTPLVSLKRGGRSLGHRVSPVLSKLATFGFR
jgi:(p)ppGpp synthase/HD superfamily hydrolase